ncbi:MAG: hypothetical protein ACRCVN_03950 [Spirochaetia bacterium]
MQRTERYLPLLGFLTFFLCTSILCAQAVNEVENQRVLFEYENWVGYKRPQGLLLVAKGRPVYIKTLNGVDNAIISKALQQVSFGIFYQKGKKTHYFLRFSPAFISGGYLEDKTSAKWQELGFATFRKRHFSLLNYFEKLQNQLTLWHIEPIYHEKQLPPGLLESTKKAKTEEERNALLGSYFWQNLYVDWTLRKNSVWLENLHIQINDNDDPVPLPLDFLTWINAGILFNQKQSTQDGGDLNNLYMTTTLATLEQQPSFTLDFGFNHLPKIFEYMEEHSSLFR